jgi:hypothetical protein
VSPYALLNVFLNRKTKKERSMKTNVSAAVPVQVSALLNVFLKYKNFVFF